MVRHLLTVVLFNQSDFLKHSNKNSDWLIAASSMRVESMLTTLLFTLETKFVLKIRNSAWGI